MADRSSTASALTDSSSGPAVSGVAVTGSSGSSSSSSSSGSSNEAPPPSLRDPQNRPSIASAVPEVDPLIGRLVNGRFKIVSVIARGGMGKVYKAEQAPLGRVCALKVLSPKYQGDRDPEFNRRFFLEAATAAKLTHPNTVTVFDYGQDGEDLYFIAMEYIEGKTLHRVLRESGPMHENRVAAICAQICRSLREAHGQGVVHRDLKPGNILVTDRGDEHDVVKVLDFGLVKDISADAEDLTQAGLFMGSPKYMAPEQILGGEITASTDIYSLGVMMFEMLVGRVPFDRGVSVKTLMAHVNDPLPSMRELNPNLRAGAIMEGIVTRCLDKEPGRRFASMKDLLLALKRVGNDDLSTITETTEGIPRARLGIELGLPASVPPPAPGSSSGPYRRESSRPQPSLGSGTPSITDTLGSVPATLAEAPPPKRTRTPLLVGVIAAVSVLGIGAAVFSGRSETTGEQPAAGSSQATAPASTPGGPGAPGTQTAAVVAPPTATGPSIRQVRVESDPPGASVSEGDTQLCTSTPCEVTWKDDAARAEHKLQVAKKGYKTTKLAVGVSEEKASAKLDVIAVAAPPSPPPPVAPPPGSGRPLYKKDF